VTRRVPPLLITSNTIFDVARRGKTFLVTPNINVAEYVYMAAHDNNNGDALDGTLEGETNKV